MKISLEELNELLKQLKISQRDFSASVESAQDKAQAISDSTAMQGQTKGAINAEIENYKIPLLLQYNDIDDALIADFEKAINDFKTTTSESSASAVIYESSLTTLEQKIAPIKSEYDQLVAKINSTQSTVSDLVSLTPLRSSGVSEGLDASKRILTKLKQDMRSFNSKKEYSTTKSLLSEQKSALKTVGKALSGGFNDSSSIKTFNDTKYLYKVLDKSKTFKKEVKEKYKHNPIFQAILQFSDVKYTNRLAYGLMQGQKVAENLKEGIAPFKTTLEKYEDMMSYMENFYHNPFKRRRDHLAFSKFEKLWPTLLKNEKFAALYKYGFVGKSLRRTVENWGSFPKQLKQSLNNYFSMTPNKYIRKFLDKVGEIKDTKVGGDIQKVLTVAKKNKTLQKLFKISEKNIADPRKLNEVMDKAIDLMDVIVDPVSVAGRHGADWIKKFSDPGKADKEALEIIEKYAGKKGIVSSIKRVKANFDRKVFGKAEKIALKKMSKEAGYKAFSKGITGKGLKKGLSHIGGAVDAVLAAGDIFENYNNTQDKDTYHNVGKSTIHAAVDYERNFSVIDGITMGATMGGLAGPEGVLPGIIAGASVGVIVSLVNSNSSFQQITNNLEKGMYGIEDKVESYSKKYGKGILNSFK